MQSYVHILTENPVYHELKRHFKSVGILFPSDSLMRIVSREL